MLILTIRTDKPEAEIGLFDDYDQLFYRTWVAHRKLAEALHRELLILLKSASKQWQDIDSIVCYHGPGSFTGLRIGVSTANALAYSLLVPIVGVGGSNWARKGIEGLRRGKGRKYIHPVYGSEANTTRPKK